MLQRNSEARGLQPLSPSHVRKAQWCRGRKAHSAATGGDAPKAGSPPCARVSAAIAVAVEWRQGRILRTRAERLRSGQDLIDFGRRLGFSAEQVRELQAKWRAEESRALRESKAIAA